MAGVTWWNFYFRLFPGAIRSPQIIQFLAHLQRHIPGKLLIIWDGLPGHRSRAVWDFVCAQKGRLWLEFLVVAQFEFSGGSVRSWSRTAESRLRLKACPNSTTSQIEPLPNFFPAMLRN